MLAYYIYELEDISEELKWKKLHWIRFKSHAFVFFD